MRTRDDSLRVGNLTLNDCGWNRAVGGVGFNNLCCSDPNRSIGSVVAWWRSNIGGWSWLWGVCWLDWVRVCARAIGDGESLRCSCGVCLGAWKAC